jgi:hypothetical protein
MRAFSLPPPQREPGAPPGAKIAKRIQNSINDLRLDPRVRTASGFVLAAGQTSGSIASGVSSRVNYSLGRLSQSINHDCGGQVMLAITNYSGRLTRIDPVPVLMIGIGVLIGTLLIMAT